MTWIHDQRESVYQLGDVISRSLCQYAAKLDGRRLTTRGSFSGKEDVPWRGFLPFFRFHRFQCQVALEDV